MITIADIAARMNLSTATISNALTGKGRVNEQKRQEIISVAEKMGYDFAKLHHSKVRQNICVAVEQAGILFTDRIVQGISTAAARYDLQPVIYNLNILAISDWKNTPPNSVTKEALKKIVAKVDSSYVGMIYVSQYPRDVSAILDRQPFPVVCVYAYTDNGIPCINYDDQQGAFIATSHLAGLGRRRIATIAGAVDSIPMTKRFAGYQRALVQYGLRFIPEYVKIANWNILSGQISMEQFLAFPTPPDAVFCQSDYIAIGAMRAIIAAGKSVPGDVAIIGFDDIDAAECVSPALTTISPPHVELGEEAVNKLYRIFSGTDDGKNSIKLECRVLARESS